MMLVRCKKGFFYRESDGNSSIKVYCAEGQLFLVKDSTELPDNWNGFRMDHFEPIRIGQEGLW